MIGSSNTLIWLVKLLTTQLQSKKNKNKANLDLLGES